MKNNVAQNFCKVGHQKKKLIQNQIENTIDVTFECYFLSRRKLLVLLCQNNVLVL